MNKIFKIVSLCLFLLFLFCFSKFSGNAQSLERLSVRGGFNFASLNLNNAIEERIRIGLNGGFNSRIRITNWIAFQPELLYTTMGTRATFDSNELNGTARIQLQYIQVPFLGVVTFFNVFSLHGGPYVSYLINSNFLSQGTFGNGGRTLERNDFRSFDIGVAAGLEVHIFSVDLGIRYQRGIVNVSGYRPLMRGGQNEVFQVYLAYHLLSLFQ
jgi:hypothetical protein